MCFASMGVEHMVRAYTSSFTNRPIYHLSWYKLFNCLLCAFLLMVVLGELSL